MRFSRTSSPAYTLNEMLIVMAIIVLLIALAVPAFNVLSGSNSIAGATNQISAVLGQARSQAIGVQEIRGVMFFIDPVTDRQNMAIVRDSGYDAGDGVTYLDLVPDMDFISLPTGVGVQTIGGGAPNGGARTTDGYIGYNKTNTVGLSIVTPYGGVILFDSSGKIVVTKYGLRGVQSTGSTMTSMDSLLTTGNVNSAGTGTGKDLAVCTNANLLTSQIGVALYDRKAFTSIPSITALEIDDDYVIQGGTYTASRKGEEAWLDGDTTLAGAGTAPNAGATLLLVNRYTGTFIRTE